MIETITLVGAAILLTVLIIGLTRCIKTSPLWTIVLLIFPGIGWFILAIWMIGELFGKNKNTVDKVTKQKYK